MGLWKAIKESCGDEPLCEPLLVADVWNLEGEGGGRTPLFSLGPLMIGGWILWSVFCKRLKQLRHTGIWRIV